MKVNVGTVDQIARVIIGLALIMLVPVFDSPYRWLALIGVVPVATGLMGYCPLYSLLGFRGTTGGRRAL